MASYRVAVLSENTKPLINVVVEAISLNSFPTVSATQTTEKEGVVTFTNLTGPHFFKPRLRRFSGTVGGVVHTGEIKVQVIALGESANYDYVVDSNGMGTHLTLFGTSGALEAAIDTGGNRSIWVCSSHSETISTKHSLTELGSNQKIMVHSGGPHRPTFTVGSGLSTDPLIDHGSDNSGAGSLLRFQGMDFNRPGAGSGGPFFQGNGGWITPRLELIDLSFDGGNGFWTFILDFSTASGADIRDILLERLHGVSNIDSIIFTNAQGSGTGSFTMRNCFWVQLDRIARRSVSTAIDAGSNGITIEGNIFLVITAYGWKRTFNKEFIFSNNIVLDFQGSDDFLEIGTSSTTSPVDAAITGNFIRCSSNNAATHAVTIGGGGGTAENISITGNALRGPGGQTAIAVDLANTDLLILNSYREWTTNVGGSTGSSGTGGDHGVLTGLADDDHSVYALLAGRSGGQTLRGGTLAGDDLKLRSTGSGVDVGVIEFEDATFHVSFGSHYQLGISNDSPAGYWRLGEGSGSLLDSSGNANSGTSNGGFTYGVSGAISGDSDTAITLNGSTGYMSVSDDAVLDLTDGPFTLEAWIKKAADGTTMSIIAKGSGAYQLRMSSDNTLHLLRENVADIVGSSITITGTDWHHVAATKTGATVKLYIDGVDVTGAITNSTMVDTSNAFHVGRRVAASDEFFNGSIDEVAVYGSVLTLAQILEHYNAGNSGRGIVSRLSFDTGDLLDYSRTNNYFSFNIVSIEQARIDSAGQLQLPIQGSGAGFVLGGDAQIYRSAANILRTPDSLIIDSALDVDGITTLSNILKFDGDTATAPTAGSLTAHIQTDISGSTPNKSLILHFDGEDEGGTGDLLIRFGRLSTVSNIFTQFFAGSAEAVRIDHTNKFLKVFGEIEIDGALNHDGSTIGFFGTTPVSQAGSAYVIANLTLDRAYDADTVVIAELADVVGTIIADLQTYGLLQ